MVPLFFKRYHIIFKNLSFLPTWPGECIAICFADLRCTVILVHQIVINKIQPIHVIQWDLFKPVSLAKHKAFPWIPIWLVFISQLLALLLISSSTLMRCWLVKYEYPETWWWFLYAFFPVTSWSGSSFHVSLDVVNRPCEYQLHFCWLTRHWLI